MTERGLHVLIVGDSEDDALLVLEEEVKIDQSFVLTMLEDDSDYRIVRGTISLAHDLGLTTVAEGIETPEAWERVRALGCDLAQGYYLSRPLSVEAATTWLRGRQEPSGHAHQVAG